MSKNTQYKILIVDDNKSNANILKYVLQNQGYEAHAVFDGFEAMENVYNIMPDVILLDIMMPGKSGYEVCEELRADERSREIPIIMVTALHADEDKMKALSIGADDFISKPINDYELFSRIKTLLKTKEQEREHHSAKNEIIALQSEKITLLETIVMGLAHEINNPLAVIAGHADILLCDTEEGTQQQRDLQIIKSQVKRIGDITKKLLTLTGNCTYDFKHINLCSVVEDAILNTQAAAEDKAVEITKILPDNKIEINGNFELLSQGLFNLVKNAVDFSVANSKVYISLEKIDDTKCLIKIKDKGIGISQENRPKIFHPFFTSKEVNEGTGLGLPFSEGIISAHSGGIKIDSTPGEGTTVEVVLPLSQRTKKILVVEDEIGILDHLVIILKYMGYTAKGVSSGRAAIEVAPEFKPDLIIMDFLMPEVNGWEAAAKIKEMEEQKDVVILGYTGYATDENIQKAKDIGFAEVLRKPIDLETLKETIIKYV